MHTDSETTDISLLGFMPYMIAVSLEMSDEPKNPPRLTPRRTKQFASVAYGYSVFSGPTTTLVLPLTVAVAPRPAP